MAEYSRFASGSFTSTGAAKAIYLPFAPTLIKLINYSAAATPANHGVPFAWWNSVMGQGFAVEQVFNATPVLTTDVVTVNGFSTFSAGLQFQYGTAQQVVASTKGATTSFQVTAHGYSTGDIVVFEDLYQSSTTGMPQLSNIPFVITVSDANNFTVNFNTNNAAYTNLAGSPSGATVKKVLYPFLYAPGQAVITAITTGTTTTVTTSAPHNFVAGQEIAFRIPTDWGTTQLNTLPNSTIPGSPIYGYVQSVSSNTQFVCNINSTGYTAFTTNIAVSSVPGLSLPQVIAIGDVNTGGAVYSGGALYPSPSFPTSTAGISTINGPAIQGASVNNTRAGFIIGAGAGTNDASSVLVGANGNVLYWEASIPDFS